MIELRLVVDEFSNAWAWNFLFLGRLPPTPIVYGVPGTALVCEFKRMRAGVRREEIAFGKGSGWTRETAPAECFEG